VNRRRHERELVEEMQTHRDRMHDPRAARSWQRFFDTCLLR
jgi:hypothetical protein